MDWIAGTGASAALALDCMDRGVRSGRQLDTELRDFAKMLHLLGERLRSKQWDPSEAVVLWQAFTRSSTGHRFKTVVGLRRALERIGPKFDRAIAGTATTEERKVLIDFCITLSKIAAENREPARRLMAA